MTWRFEPVSRLRCHRPSPIVRASATRVPNTLPPDCTNTPPAIGAPGSGAFPVALRAPSNAPDPIKQTAAIRSPDQGHAVPCRRWTPDLCGNRPPLTRLPASAVAATDALPRARRPADRQQPGRKRHPTLRRWEEGVALLGHPGRCACQRAHLLADRDRQGQQRRAVPVAAPHTARLAHRHHRRTLRGPPALESQG